MPQALKYGVMPKAAWTRASDQQQGSADERTKQTLVQAFAAFGSITAYCVLRPERHNLLFDPLIETDDENLICVSNRKVRNAGHLALQCDCTVH
jgi:hypothetical protein